MSIEMRGKQITQPMGWISTREASSAAAWRTQRPALDLAKCTGCLICWKFCPEPAISRVDEKVAIDMTTCKGCGVCAHECPVDAITMHAEGL